MNITKKSKKYVIFANGGMELSLVGPGLGGTWEIQLDADGKRFFTRNMYMPNESLDETGLDAMKEEAYDKIVESIEKMIAAKQQELRQAEDVLKKLTEGKA